MRTETGITFVSVAALLSILLAPSFAAPGHGMLAQAEAESGSEARASTSGESERQPAPKKDEAGKRSDRSKKFRPSERITTDSAVSFPVDI